MIRFTACLLLLSFSSIAFSQTIQELVDQVSQDGIVQMVRYLSGEDSVMIAGNLEHIQHRNSQMGNDLAADYIEEVLASYGLETTVINYSEKGRNVIATQLGSVNPESIYIISGHYDSVGNYGADDNASGVVGVLETARILSNYAFENTIIYALWDEEEINLNGSEDYANTASQNGDNILAVINMDMIGYDADDNRLFDIDVRDFANSYEIRDDLLGVVEDYNLDLMSNVVDPGTFSSDHSSFWLKGYSAVLLGEGWSENDINTGYHTPNNDRLGLFNIPYFYNMVKLCVGYTVTKAVLVLPSSNQEITVNAFKLFPNPASNLTRLDFGKELTGKLEIYNIQGQLLQTQKINGTAIELQLTGLQSELYLLKISADNGEVFHMKLQK